MALSNALVYQGALQAGSPQVAAATLVLPRWPQLRAAAGRFAEPAPPPWLVQVSRRSEPPSDDWRGLLAYTWAALQEAGGASRQEMIGGGSLAYASAALQETG